MANSFKNARKYLIFDVEAFQAKHAFQLLRVEPGFSYIDGKREDVPSHVKLLVMVVADYSDGPEGVGPNQWTQLTVKLLKVLPTPANMASLNRLLGTQVGFTDLEVAVYGDYQNQLSMKANSLYQVKNDQA